MPAARTSRSSRPRRIPIDKTESVYRGYAFVSESDLREAVEKLATILPNPIRLKAEALRRTPVDTIEIPESAAFLGREL